MTTAAPTLTPTPWDRIRRTAATPGFARVLSVAVFLLSWQFLAPLLPTDLIPTPLRVLQFMWDEVRGVTLARENLYQAFGTSLRRLGLGFFLAIGIGTPIGLLMGLSRTIENFAQDFFVVGLAMPSLVWALLTGIWFGMGDTAPVVTVFLAALPFIVINTFEGVRDVSKELTDMALAFRVSRLRTLRHVVMGSLMPFFFAALRYGLANGWKGLVLAEVFASTAGAGWTINYWRDAHRAHGVFGYALFFVIFALTLEYLVFRKLSDRVFRWRPEIVATNEAPAEALAERASKRDRDEEG